MSYRNNPTILGHITAIKDEADADYSEVVTGIGVYRKDARYPGGRVDIDIRNILKHENVVLRVDAEELMTALARAMVNRQEE